MSEQAISRVLFSVSVTLYGTTIIHLRALVAQYLLRPTRKLGRAALKRFPIRSCSKWGLPSFPSRPGNWCALTAPFHPYPARRDFPVSPGGVFSVALSFASPRLRVTEHSALWSSDFPPASTTMSKIRAIVWPTLTYCLATLRRALYSK